METIVDTQVHHLSTNEPVTSQLEVTWTHRVLARLAPSILRGGLQTGCQRQQPFAGERLDRQQSRRRLMHLRKSVSKLPWHPPVVLGLLALCGLCAAAELPQRSSPLTTAAEVHNLPHSRIPGRPIQISGVVTYYDPVDDELFFQDSTGGVFIETTKPYPIESGAYVSVEGVAAAGYRSDVAANPVIHVRGKGRMPAAPLTDYATLARGEADCRLVTVRGLVQAATVERHGDRPLIHLDLRMPGGEVEVYEPVSADSAFATEGATGSALRSMLDASVEVVAVAGGAFDAKSQLTGLVLYAKDSSAVHILRRSAWNASDIPTTQVDQVFRSRNVIDSSRRLRVRGYLTYYKKGESAVLDANGKSILVQTRETKDLPLGELVDALGFASDQEYAPSLRQAELYDLGTRRKIEPRPVTYHEAQSGLYSDNLISLQGLLVSELYGTTLETLLINVDGHYVTGRLEDRSPLPHLKPGTLVRLTGICRIVAGGQWRAPMFFHIDMRTPADLAVLSAPSWWTQQHLVYLLSCLFALAAAVAAWALLLRRRVRQQTARMQRTMLIAKRRSALLEQITPLQTPETLFYEICTCLVELLPGTVCEYSIECELGSTCSEGLPPDKAFLLFTTKLLGTEGEVIGSLSVSAPDRNVSLETPEDVFAMISEVASLAIQQLLLHQGLVHHSTHDALTDLPNRRLCELRLLLAITEAAERQQRVDVIYIDVDRFKHVNDRFGHRIGDLYLKEIGRRLLQETRSTDTLARIGGDEFLVIAPQAPTTSTPAELRLRLQSCFSEPFFLEGERVDGSASMGVASFPDHGTNAEELKRHSDHDMYLQKRSAAFGSELAASPEISVVSPEELEAALEGERFRLAYQPQFAVNGELRGMEALLRLEDPILGLLTPNAFIAVAERCDIILPLGRWVLERGMQDYRNWHLDTGPIVLLVVNVSMRQVAQPDFAESVLASLDRCAFPADRLELELTERTLSDSKEVTRQLKRLREAGIRISLDDFGTGESSLSLLHRLPIDTVKIDRSFIVAMETEPGILPVIQAIADMALRLKKRIVAEGIETTTPVPTLLSMGEMEFQGYLLSRPVAADKIPEHLDKWLAGYPMPAAFLPVPVPESTVQPGAL